MGWRGKLETAGERARRTIVRRGLELLDPELAPIAALREQVLDVFPPDPLALDPNVFVPTVEHGAPGIDFREDEQLRLIDRWRGYAELVADLRTDRSLSRGGARSGRILNGQFHTPDAEVYAALIADRKPAAIVEVGAGYSTRIARAAVDLAGLDSEITVVDPRPRVAIDSAAHTVVQARIEDAPEPLRLESGSFLFVDSSHVVRAGGDVPFLFGEVVPALPPGVLIHVHDVFCPWDYPEAYRRRLYTEQYLVQALLSGSPRYRIVFTSQLMPRRHAPELRAAFGPAVGADPDCFGSSLWFEIAEP